MQGLWSGDKLNIHFDISVIEIFCPKCNFCHWIDEILIDYLKTKNIDISKNYEDCGLILYDIKKQNVFAGASGPASSALVVCSYILKEMERGKYRKVLLVPTGAIFSPTRTFQKDSIPSIAHAISFEVSE